MKDIKFSQTGSMLIEALVALVVVGVGTFGVVKLNTVMLNGTGLSKTRAEALQVALKRMEDTRNYALNTGCAGNGTTTETDLVTGVNANYKVATVIADATTQSINVDVCVAWDGTDVPCSAAADKRVILKSIVSCVGVGTSGMIGGNATASTGGKVKTPTGAARVGGRSNPTCPVGSCVTTINNTNNKPDNTKVYKTGNLVELVDTVTNKVLLTVEDGSTFSTISGRVYIEADNSGNPIVDADGTDSSIQDDNVFVLSSDASYCARIFPTDAASIIPAGATGNNIKYRYFDYNCYVSKGWWGNIGIVRLDNPNSNNRVCVGDTAISSTETSLWSKKSALSISRGYRSYREILLNGVGTGTYETIGIGLDTTTGLAYTPTAIPSTANASTEHHDFLITVITGNGTCQSSGKMNLTSPSQFAGNQGKFYCMSGQCPGLTQTISTPSTLIHGTITKGTGAVITAPVDTDCTSTTWTDNGSTYSYSCQLNWTGFSGSAWQGSISFGATGTNTLCSSGNTTAAITPSTSSVAFTVNNQLASTNPNSLTFTDVPLAVTDVTIDFTASAASCTTLGTPNIAWGTASNKGNLVWSAIANANVYKAATCTSTSATCTPSGSTTVTSPYTPTTPTAGSTTCISITATDSANTYANSIASAVKCVKATAGNGNNVTLSYN